MRDSPGRASPIGVFDSGVGGLTVLRALAAELPHEHFVYLGDTARLPYGTKSPETVARYALQAAEALSEYGVKCLVIACNTASSVGLPAIRERIEGVPIIGVIEPGAEAACAASRSGYIAVVATEGTVRGGAYQEAILRLRRDARVTAHPAQLFVALAEEGLCEGSIADSVARHYLGYLFHTRRLDDGLGSAHDAASLHGSFSSSKAPSHVNKLTRPDTLARPDTLVLGCTHFPMLAGSIRAAVGPDVNIVDSAATTASSVRETLERAGLTRTAGEGKTRFLATDAVERFARIGSRFLERPISPEEVELVDL
ncbi:MAG: murI [Gammaproteobacteria bacterium]|nr:murI [Gammaproteobacteria bacterium]